MCNISLSSASCVFDSDDGDDAGGGGGDPRDLPGDPRRWQHVAVVTSVSGGAFVLHMGLHRVLSPRTHRCYKA